MQTISTGYKPRPLQQVLHNKLKRFNVLVIHRRFGKTVLAVNEIVDQALRNTQRNPHYAYVGPSYGQVKRVAWDYMKDATRSIPGVKFNEQDLRVEISRPDRGDKITIWLLSGENPDSLRGIYLDGVVLDEYAEQNPVIWSQVLRPALSDRLGWALFIGTVKGKNHFHDIWKAAQNLDNWYTAILRASETGVIAAAELHDARATMSPEEYAQEYECQWDAALVGAYYGKQMADAGAQGRITGVPYDPRFPVATFWDLGLDDALVIWFMQEAGREFHFFDYYEVNNKSLVEVTADLRIKGYEIAEINLPHDAEQRELSNGNSRRETIAKLFNPHQKPGTSPACRVNVIARHRVEDRINAVRMLLPRCWFDAVKCRHGIEALQNYQGKWEAKDKTFRAEPLHNWASHGSDGFGQFAMGYREQMKQNTRNLPRESETQYNIYDY